MDWPSRARAAAASRSRRVPPVLLRPSGDRDDAGCCRRGRRRGCRCPGPPISTSSPAPPVQGVVAGAADQDVVAVAAIGGEQHAGQSRRLDDVVAAEAVDDDAIVAPRSWRSSPSLAQTRHRDHAVVVGDRDRVVAVGRVDDDRVRRPSPTAAGAARSMLTLLTSVPVRSLTVMVSAPPRALKSIVSTSSRSMVMLATSRVSRAARRWPRCRCSR